MKRWKKGETLTAAEAVARLQADPEFRRQQTARDEAFRRRQEELALAEAPVVQALRDAGAQITSVWDLVNTTRPYPELIPVLLAHLDGPYPETVRESIARALATRAARPYWDELVSRFLAEKDETTHGMKWALHLAVARAADLSVIGELIALAHDGRHGGNRALFVDALARMNDPRADAELVKLAHDPDLAGDVKRVMDRRRKRKRKDAGPIH